VSEGAANQRTENQVAVNLADGEPDDGKAGLVLLFKNEGEDRHANRGRCQESGGEVDPGFGTGGVVGS
jgi:hypothetical protein